ncbi:MAG: (Fe-S)-binding protein [Desulfobacteraceae bacterium]|nr:MAG: (Fe-S)-binding protein [Desulfobacteraceae bacterium]
MGHLTVKNYNSLYKRMDQFVNGVFDSKSFYEILKILFTDEEAFLCSLMPLLPASLEKISQIWEISVTETQTILNTLTGKGLVYEDDFEGSTLYTLAIPVFGFFEFSLMRNDGMFDRKALSSLYNQYITEDDHFVRKYFGSNPPISRTFVQENVLSEDIVSEILSYEKSSHIIEVADTISVGTCFCRHKMEHAGKACDNPQDVCLSFGSIAKTLIEKGIAREITKAEAHEIVKNCIAKGLVQIGDNVKNKPAVICNCCSCCCDLLLSYKRTGLSTIVTPSHYISRIDHAACDICGLCIEKCPVDAIRFAKGKVVVDARWCLGCGVCANFCKTKACKMEARPVKVDVPEDTLRKVVLSAIHQKKVGNFLFDNQKSTAHKILREFINFLIKIPPIKWMLLKKTVQDRLLAFVLKKCNMENFNI